MKKPPTHLLACMAGSYFFHRAVCRTAFCPNFGFFPTAVQSCGWGRCPYFTQIQSLLCSALTCALRSLSKVLLTFTFLLTHLPQQARSFSDRLNCNLLHTSQPSPPAQLHRTEFGTAHTNPSRPGSAPLVSVHSCDVHEGFLPLFLRFSQSELIWPSLI